MSAAKSAPAIAWTPIVESRSSGRIEPGRSSDVLDEFDEPGHAGFEPDGLVRRRRSANRREHGAIDGNQRDVRLRIASVDGENEGRHPGCCAGRLASASTATNDAARSRRAGDDQRQRFKGLVRPRVLEDDGTVAAVDGAGDHG